jgi:2',3'-cyclic-nucleotide 2'-phosphodiesterase (5'-nucleotidase family)
MQRSSLLFVALLGRYVLIWSSRPAVHAEGFLSCPTYKRGVFPDFLRAVSSDEISNGEVGSGGGESERIVTKRKRSGRGGGGRPPSKDDELSSNIDDHSIGECTKAPKWQPSQCQPGEARLIVLQITDVYTLEHLASFKTLLEETKANAKDSRVISILTGDFLMPYLLSSLDSGAGMMNALNQIIDYLCWGNHEADLSHKTVCKHVRNFPGTWLNSNMLDHDAMDAQQEFDIISVCSADGKNQRSVGLVSLLSNDPNLYSQFKAPGAFGGATIDDPWETLRRLQANLMGPDSKHRCDTIIPLQHLYVPDDHITCKNFDFPVILSGHDHHRVDQVVEGTRLLKPGMDAIYTTVLEMVWTDKNIEGNKPKIKANFVKTSDWEPDPILEAENERAYDVLEPLRNTELASVPENFQPLSSVNSRGTVTTMGQYICSLLKTSMNVSRRQRELKIDAVLLMGGNIRGGQEYDTGSFFSLEALEAEVKSDDVVAVVPMPGWLLADGVSATHSGEAIPGWMQYDSGILEDFSLCPPVVTHVAGNPIDLNKTYYVATKIGDLTNGQSPPWTTYFKVHTELLPPKGAYVNIQAELMSYFAKSLWRRIWDCLSERLNEECDATKMAPDSSVEVCTPDLRLETLDTDQDGVVSVEDIQHALKDIVGLSIDRREQSLAEIIHRFADTNGTGEVTLEDIVLFCEEFGGGLTEE